VIDNFLKVFIACFCIRQDGYAIRVAAGHTVQTIAWPMQCLPLIRTNSKYGTHRSSCHYLSFGLFTQPQCLVIFSEP